MRTYDICLMFTLSTEVTREALSDSLREFTEELDGVNIDITKLEIDEIGGDNIRA